VYAKLQPVAVMDLSQLKKFARHEDTESLPVTDHGVV
jgi:hypothetical protein